MSLGGVPLDGLIPGDSWAACWMWRRQGEVNLKVCGLQRPQLHFLEALFLW